MMHNANSRRQRLSTAIVLPVALTLALSACENQEDAFDIAKDHVWGDRLRGCDYQSIIFSDAWVVKVNSDALIELRKQSSHHELPMDQDEEYPIKSVERQKNRFIVSYKNSESKSEYIINEKTLTSSGHYIDGKWYDITDEDGDNNKYQPRQFKICRDIKTQS